MNVLDEIETERQRRLHGREAPDPHARILWGRALSALPSDSERGRLQSAFEFAKGIEYAHEGLTGEIYFSHPMRVAALALLIDDAESADAGMLGVLHNVFEVSDVSPDELAEVFGHALSDQVAMLTVDRSVQWERSYKTAYYRAIAQGPRTARIVKILDKLDNLFLLGLNPDEQIRTRYLSEIEDFVLPMTETTLPSLKTYLSALVEDCRRTGFIGDTPTNCEKESI